MSRNAICAVSTDSTTACLGRFGFGAGLTPITSARTRGIATSKSVYGRAPRSPMHMCEKHDKHLSAQVPTKYRLLQYATTESHSQSPICGAGALTELTTVTAGMRSSRPNGSMLTGRSRNANVLRPDGLESFSWVCIAARAARHFHLAHCATVFQGPPPAS